MNSLTLLRAASIKVKNSTVTCKIIGCTSGCCEGKYVETQTNENPGVQVGSGNECLKVVYIQPNVWPWSKKKKMA